MMRFKGALVSVFAVIAASASVAAYAALSSPAASRVGFEASGPGGMKIEGTTADLSVIDAEGNLAIDVPLVNLSTGIALRDHHMKEKYLEVPKYPSATLTVARAALRLPTDGTRTEADVAGTLKLHGQARPVTVHYEAKGEAGGFSVSGRFHVMMGDYGISVPSYLGVTVKQDVGVTASFHVAGS